MISSNLEHKFFTLTLLLFHNYFQVLFYLENFCILNFKPWEKSSQVLENFPETGIKLTNQDLPFFSLEYLWTSEN